jgi:hypothetical protein
MQRRFNEMLSGEHPSSKSSYEQVYLIYNAPCRLLIESVSVQSSEPITGYGNSQRIAFTIFVAHLNPGAGYQGDNPS